MNNTNSGEEQTPQHCQKVRRRRSAPKLVINKSKAQSVLLYSIRQQKSPIHRKHRGYRLIAIIPNKNRVHPKTGEAATSWHPRFRIAELGDFIKYEDALYWLPAFLKALKACPISATRLIEEE